MEPLDPWDDLPEHAARRPVVDAPPDGPGRSRRATDHELRGAYRALRAQMLARWAAERAECHFGDGRLDFTLAHGDPRAVTVHHSVPVALRPDLEMETSLWRPSHALCNKLNEAAFGGSDTDVVPDTGVASERW